MKNRVTTLDALRVAAMGLVLTAHIGQELRHPLGRFFGFHDFYRASLGGMAVTVFLVLSGAVLQRGYGDRPLRTGDFLAKRVVRIYPIYWMSLVIGVGAAMLRSWLRTGQLFAGFPKLHAADITLGLTGTYAFVGRWGGPFNGVAWFVGLIMSLYLLFPLLHRFFRRSPHLSILGLAALSAGTRYLVGRYSLLPLRPLDWFPICRVFEFGLGMYLAAMAARIRWRLPGPPRRPGDALAFLGGLTFPLFLVHYPLIFLVNHLRGRGWGTGRAVLLFLALSLFLSWLVHFLDSLLPRQRILRWFGVGARRELVPVAPDTSSGSALSGAWPDSHWCRHGFSAKITGGKPDTEDQEGAMPTFVLMTKLSPALLESPSKRRRVGREWKKAVDRACPEVTWTAHYALLGPYDFMDIYEAPDADVAAKVALITQANGALKAESWTALPYARYLEIAREVGEVDKD